MGFKLKGSSQNVGRHGNVGFLAATNKTVATTRGKHWGVSLGSPSPTMVLNGYLRCKIVVSSLVTLVPVKGNAGLHTRVGLYTQVLASSRPRARWQTGAKSRQCPTCCAGADVISDPVVSSLCQAHRRRMMTTSLLSLILANLSAFLPSPNIRKEKTGHLPHNLR